MQYSPDLGRTRETVSWCGISHIYSHRHLRELLGRVTKICDTRSDGEGEDGLGAYQSVANDDDDGVSDIASTTDIDRD